MLCRWPLPLALLGLLAVPASAANQSVSATFANEFTPADFTIQAGDDVTWENNGGSHNVKFDNGSFEQPADPSTDSWRVARGFDTPGTYRFYCEEHGGPRGAGMSGKVTVLDPAADPPVTAFTIRTRAARTQRRAQAFRLGIRLDEFECSKDCRFTVKLRINRRTARRLDLGRRARTVGRTSGTHLARFGPKRIDVSVFNSFYRALRSRPRFKVKLLVASSAHGTERRAERARGRRFRIKLVP